MTWISTPIRADAIKINQHLSTNQNRAFDRSDYIQRPKHDQPQSSSLQWCFCHYWFEGNFITWRSCTDMSHSHVPVMLRSSMRRFYCCKSPVAVLPLAIVITFFNGWSNYHSKFLCLCIKSSSIYMHHVIRDEGWAVCALLSSLLLVVDAPKQSIFA